MKDPKEQGLDILSEIQSTSIAERPRRLEKLAKPMLVHLVGLALAEWRRDKDRLEAEIEKRDFHISKLEALLAGSGEAAKP